MERIIDDIVVIFTYILMLLMVTRALIATDFFHIYKTLIGFMLTLIIFYITKRVVCVEKKSGGYEHD